ncbi:hypothetical protein CANARDRAFT_5727 [[Candida] arabinofermentans NRRL YB-2248]|uniref:Phosphomevalonate kinase n=1 Tax=[Candida] arabinofermentans NRRL YB-2248 TaxID=983967 RepID=A0A1E4T5Z7_9ASCO|nr:hypothetical protein CANARDRAFT_5727 [[Candida] arabinofermentans NRRL YB-2248]
MTSRTFSAPGKALLAGGYLVLDPQYRSLVIALSSRMYAHASVRNSNDGALTITVSSPQFKDGQWSYKINYSDDTDTAAVNMVEVNGRSNPFIESTINTILTYLKYPVQQYDIQITMFSDKEYHSQANTTSKKVNDNKNTFLFHTEPITQVPKTGLGSSAALVTSLTTALLSCYEKSLNINDPATLSRIHNLSQVAHCLAQGKVGSGFDVASATFGSIVYRRFDPELINNLIEKQNSPETLIKLINETDWKITNDKCGLPKGIKLLMGDIKGGSETPKLVNKVLNWRKLNPVDSLKLWTDLNSANMKLIDALNSLQTVNETDQVYYNQLIQSLSSKSAVELVANHEIDTSPLALIASSIFNIRLLLKKMTTETGAEIEPDDQTSLLDACSKIPGVLGGVVPGAGGYDAVCLLVSESQVDTILNEMSKNEIFQTVEWLDLREVNEGIVEEEKFIPE